MNFLILFNGLFKGMDVDITEGYNQFMFNRLLAQIDNNKYVHEICNIMRMGEMEDWEHWALLKSVIPKGYHKNWPKPHVFAILQDIEKARGIAALFNYNEVEYVTKWLNMTAAQKTKENKKIDEYKKNTFI